MALARYLHPAIQRLQRSIDMNFCLPSQVRPVIAWKDDR